MHFKNGTPAKVGDLILHLGYMSAPFVGVVTGQTSTSDTCNLYAVPVGLAGGGCFTAKECLRLDEAMNPKSTEETEKHLRVALDKIIELGAEREETQNALHNALEGRRVAQERETELTKALQELQGKIPAGFDIEEATRGAYDAYCVAVGGKAFNGDPLPTWEDFATDPAKEKQAEGWRDATRAALAAAFPGLYSVPANPGAGDTQTPAPAGEASEGQPGDLGSGAPPSDTPPSGGPSSEGQSEAGPASEGGLPPV